jgi:hypothetical protein
MLRRSSLVECVTRNVFTMRNFFLSISNETRFGPKQKSSPIYLGPNNLDTFDALDEREIAT